MGKAHTGSPHDFLQLHVNLQLSQNKNCDFKKQVCRKLELHISRPSSLAPSGISRAIDFGNQENLRFDIHLF